MKVEILILVLNLEFHLKAKLHGFSKELTVVFFLKSHTKTSYRCTTVVDQFRTAYWNDNSMTRITKICLLSHMLYRANILMTIDNSVTLIPCK